MLGSNFALLVKSPRDDGQQLLTTGSRLVGCVPSAAVAVSGGVGEGACLQVPLLEVYTPPPPKKKNRITDRCKNITFPQLRLRTATYSNET